VVNRDDQILSIYFVPEGEILAKHAQLLKRFFHVQIEKCWAYRRILVHSIFKIEFNVVTFKLES
jgi:hypothetical protein